MAADSVICLLDFDNTLIDNDRIVADLLAYLEHEVGDNCRRRYWEIFEELRAKLDYTDYLGALQRFRDEHPHDPHLVSLSLFLLNYRFDEVLFPKAIEAIAYLCQWSKPVILADGDVLLQSYKLEKSGVYNAVEKRVLICVHKENELDLVAERYPADHYVMVDDKLRVLTAMKEKWGDKLTTVFPRQGHYALDPDILGKYPAADVTIEHVRDLLEYDLKGLVPNA
jgi:FMN phosphatase YigB (HAD superfamily)